MSYLFRRLDEIHTKVLSGADRDGISRDLSSLIEQEFTKTGEWHLRVRLLEDTLHTLAECVTAGKDIDSEEVILEALEAWRVLDDSYRGVRVNPSEIKMRNFDDATL